MPTDELILRRAYSYLDFPHSEVVSRPVRPIPAHQTASSLLGPYMSGPPEEYLPVDLRFGYPRSGIKTMLAQLCYGNVISERHFDRYVLIYRSWRWRSLRVIQRRGTTPMGAHEPPRGPLYALYRMHDHPHVLLV